MACMVSVPKRELIMLSEVLKAIENMVYSIDDKDNRLEDVALIVSMRITNLIWWIKGLTNAKNSNSSFSIDKEDDGEEQYSDKDEENDNTHG